jgi:acyl-CoA synthetase (AMP-forming)/AMP-acid ligase II
MWVYPEIRFLADLVTYHARRTPNKLAMTYGEQRYDYAALEVESARVANALLAEGVKTQDRVVFFGKNSADFFLAMFGSARSGACFIPLNWRLAAPELAQVSADAAPVFAIVEREFEAVWQEVCKEAGITTGYVVIDDAQRLSAWSGGYAAVLPKLNLREDDAVIQLYTSGTTGVPKGVLHTHASFNHSRLSEHFERAYHWQDGEVFLYALPNFHLLGVALSLQCLYNGVALCIQKQFHPQEFLAGIEQSHPTLLVLTPTMIQLLIDHPDAAKTNFSSLKLLMYAGSPISLGLLKRALSIMPCEFMQFYGQTETSGPVSLLRPDEHNLEVEQTLKSCGRPLPLIRLRVVDEQGNDVPDGTPGELLICAPSASAGYWNRPEETDARFKDGWYASGDVAYRDTDGLYYIYDRLKDLIVSGGENIYCAEVENVLSIHPAVASVAVIGVPDARWGEAVKAVVVLHAGKIVSHDDLLHFCRQHLAGYKVPKSIDFVDEFPLTGTGKISKKDIRAPYWANMQRSVA